MIACFATCTACSETLRVNLPDPPENARALLAAVEHDGAVDVEAISLESPAENIQLPYVDGFRGDGRIVALYYEQSLEELDLARGKIERADSGPDRSRLPTADAAFAALIRDDRVDAFSPISSLDPGG